jgi:hypothetical protein
MGRSCTVCSHEAAFEVNEALVVERASYRDISRRFDLSKDAVARHREHIPQLLFEGSQALKIFEADVILERLEGLFQESIAVLEAAKNEGDPRLVLSAIDRAGKQVERLAELRGDISRQPVANIILSGEWAELRDRIAVALAPFPAAASAVHLAIEGADNGVR